MRWPSDRQEQEVSRQQTWNITNKWGDIVNKTWRYSPVNNEMHWQCRYCLRPPPGAFSGTGFHGQMARSPVSPVARAAEAQTRRKANLETGDPWSQEFYCSNGPHTSFDYMRSWGPTFLLTPFVDCRYTKNRGFGGMLRREQNDRHSLDSFFGCCTCAANAGSISQGF